MNVAQVGQVGHAGRDASQQPHELDDGELSVVSLRRKMKKTKEPGKNKLRADRTKRNAAEQMRRVIRRKIFNQDKVESVDKATGICFQLAVRSYMQISGLFDIFDMTLLSHF